MLLRENGIGRTTSAFLLEIIILVFVININIHVVHTGNWYFYLHNWFYVTNNPCERERERERERDHVAANHKDPTLSLGLLCINLPKSERFLKMMCRL